ncbi:CLUMA_CG014363, isoform A [Clunio marinus]|uniref:RNA helicase n=1 Tax=Clunio marinus TaxID=568069 RepID=A0A1J1IP64_9DIPT|nr:CLUMA_CG014363, isoform A [Clunio marinus]
MNKTLEEQRRQLPAYAVRQNILNCIQTSSTLILIGETGSGKSTQIPQFILESGMLNKGMVGITQPRRVAAITLSKRVSQEKMRQLGDVVGYAVRFENCTSENTKIKYMTEGILLREALNDRFLKKYQYIILDEAHERTVNTDVLFGIVKSIQKERSMFRMQELKIIIMSATMDVDHFSKYFNNCTVLYMPGRMHQVQVMHSKHRQDDYMFATLVTLFEIHRTAPLHHDVLVFLTGKDEIESMTSQIRNITRSHDLAGQPPLRAWPLHSALPAQRQLEAFQRSGENYRRVVVATNIAETSITLPGIKYVIDTGVVKTRKFDPITGLDSLKVTKISQAQAWQRTGRAGRESDGICYRTYTANEYDLFEKMTKPEILRCNLSSTILQLLALGINIETFDFMDKPPRDSIEVAFKQLKQLGAIKSVQNPQLTETGHRMSKFPIDPIYSKIIISSPKFECVNDILDLVAILSTENVYCEPNQNNRDQATAQHSKFQTRYGDHLTLLNIFTEYKKHNKSKQWCTEHFLNQKSLQYAFEVRQQLAEICDNVNVSSQADSPHHNVDQIRKCLITGLFNNVAELQQRDNHYIVMANRQRAMIHPSSVLSGYHANLNGFSSSSNGNGIISNMGNKLKDAHNQKANYVLFSEIVHTTQVYLRTATRIEPEWIQEVVPDCGYASRINNNQL